MEGDTIAIIFDPFFPTKAPDQGTGLGLSPVYGLVQQHLGIIQVESEFGEGTAFKIYLPAIERSGTAVGGEIESLVKGGTETILLAEDDEMVRNLTRTILEAAGYTILTADDGEEALRVFEKHVDAIDLAVLDVVMPKLGGRAVYERIREARADTRILFCSGYSVSALHTDFILDEDVQLIQKPFQRDNLLRSVRAVLDE